MHFICTHGHKHLIQKAGRTRRPKVTNTHKRIEALSDRMSKVMQVNLVKGITKIKNKVNPDVLYKAWKTGSYGHIMETIPWSDLPEDIHGVNKPMTDAALMSGMISMTKMPKPVQAKLRWDTSNPMIRDFIKGRTGMLIHQNIMQDTTSVIQHAVHTSFTEALYPSDVARMVKGSIGLLPKHAIAVENYRRSLEKNGFAPDRIDKLTGSYQDRLLKYRATVIARSEIGQASQHGQLSVWKEAVNQGLLNRETARKSWVTDGDPCEICDPMDGISVPLDGMWELNNGDTVEIPKESHPQCLCEMEFEFGQSDDSEEEE